MKVGKSCGPDMISLRLLKECVNSISSPLCTLFNKQLGSGCFPKLWNVANLDPVFKSDDKEIVDNYRGISLLSVVSKVLQKCIFSRVFPFFQTKLYHLQDSWKLSTETISVSVHVIFYFEVLLAFILIFETENRIKLSSQNTGQINHPISFLIKKPITSLFWMLYYMKVCGLALLVNPCVRDRKWTLYGVVFGDRALRYRGRCFPRSTCLLWSCTVIVSLGQVFLAIRRHNNL